MHFSRTKNTITFFTLLALLAASSLNATVLNPFIWFKNSLVITDVSQTSVIPIHHLYKPQSVTELQQIVLTTALPIAIAGGRFSQGGHIAYPHGIVIDTTALNNIIALDTTAQTITVQTGAIWRNIQKYIAPYNLSIKVMQSYNDFTVGGSLSVNVHGRDINYGPLIETVQSIEVLLANGTIMHASRTQNPDLFAGAIGGYGAFGIITQATLSLTSNEKITREIKLMPLNAYTEFFLKHIKGNPQAVFHNANLYPDKLSHVASITWHKADKLLSTAEHLQPVKKVYPIHMAAEQLLRRIPLLHSLRPKLFSVSKESSLTVLRNYEMSSTVNTLEPLLRFPTTTVLQEYFIPIHRLMDFVAQLDTLIGAFGINILNISIRYIPHNNESMLSYATKESFSLVLYINILNTQSGLKAAQVWTQQLIDAALGLEGTYYMPYQLFGTKEQVKKAYPRFDEFLAVKKIYDPSNRFSNSFLKKYSE